MPATIAALTKTATFTIATAAAAAAATASTRTAAIVFVVVIVIVAAVLVSLVSAVCTTAGAFIIYHKWIMIQFPPLLKKDMRYKFIYYF